MNNTNFDYSVSSRRNSTTPLTAELMCTEVFRKQIRFFTDEINLLSLPERTIVSHSTSIPLNETNSSTKTRNYVVVARSPNETTVISRPSKTTNNHSLNCARILKIMGSFGVTEHGCSTILRDIEKAIISSSSSSSSKWTGAIEVKIWKIRTVVYKLNKDVERLLMERCYSDISEISSLRVLGYNSNGSSTMEDKNA
ncbi:hypothetical protein V5N11_025236 [Cardamine amara subsp. amara]|uniref:Uncharacterized protein n=1 Tax=Cardamine amara subsp. amara TaxID=228776 RepID=A0ABD1BFZ4_CARAN